MKYVKLYESFETDLEDILLEITDLGYEYYIDYFTGESEHINALIIDNKKGETYIIFDEVKDCLLRLKDYLGNRFIDCTVYNGVLSEWKYKSINLTEYSNFDFLISIVIEYK